MENPINIREILSYLPHRYPFIMVDRILELVPGQRVVGIKNVSANEPCFQGHFPGDPIMPGVLIVEAMGQVGGILAYESMANVNPGTIIFFMGFDKVRFRKPVIPGDQLVMEATILNLRSRAVKMLGIARVNDEIVAQGEVLAAAGERA